MKQKKLIFNFFVNRNWKKLTDSRKKAKILGDNRKSHYPIETLLLNFVSISRVFFYLKHVYTRNQPQPSRENVTRSRIDRYNDRKVRLLDVLPISS